MGRDKEYSCCQRSALCCQGDNILQHGNHHVWLSFACFSIDFFICLSFKSTAYSKGFGHYDSKVRKEEHSLERGREGLWRQSSGCSAGTRDLCLSAHTTWSTRKKMGAAWPSGQHCRENNGQRLVVNKLMWKTEVLSSYGKRTEKQFWQVVLLFFERGCVICENCTIIRIRKTL